MLDHVRLKVKDLASSQKFGAKVLAAPGLRSGRGHGDDAASVAGPDGNQVEAVCTGQEMP